MVKSLVIDVYLLYQVWDLLLKILMEMSSVFLDVLEGDFSYGNILNKFLDDKIGEMLCFFFYLEEFCQNMESLENLLIIIRNLSFVGRFILFIFYKLN